MKLDRFEKAKAAEMEYKNELDSAVGIHNSAVSAAEDSLARYINNRIENGPKLRYGAKNAIPAIEGEISRWRNATAEADKSYEERKKAANDKFAATLAAL